MYLKKILAIMLVILIVFPLAGCRENTIENTSTYDNTSLQIPDNITSLHSLYKEVKNKQLLSYDISDISSSTSSGNTTFSFSFIEKYTDYSYMLQERDETEEYKVFIDEHENSFQIPLKAVTFVGPTRKPREEFCRDVILATFYVLDPEAGFIQAAELSKKLINSYSEGTMSKVIEVNDYYVFLVPDDTVVFEGFTIECRNKKDVFPPLAESEKVKFNTIQYDSVASPDLNEGIKYKVKGKVLSCEKASKSTSFSSQVEYCILIQSTDGEKYAFMYNFQYNPVTFDKGKTYTFYGEVQEKYDGIPALYLHGYE